MDSNDIVIEKCVESIQNLVFVTNNFFMPNCITHFLPQ